jgi:uncharacterized MnhB-related membrane protein
MPFFVLYPFFSIFLDKILHALFISSMSAACIALLLLHLQVAEIGPDADMNHFGMTSEECKWY